MENIIKLYINKIKANKIDINDVPKGLVKRVQEVLNNEKGDAENK